MLRLSSTGFHIEEKKADKANTSGFFERPLTSQDYSNDHSSSYSSDLPTIKIKEEIVPIEQNDHKYLSKQEIEILVNRLQGNSKAQFACAKYTKAVIEILISNQLPKEKVNTRPGTNNDSDVQWSIEEIKKGEQFVSQPGVITQLNGTLFNDILPKISLYEDSDGRIYVDKEIIEVEPQIPCLDHHKVVAYLQQQIKDLHRLALVGTIILFWEKVSKYELHFVAFRADAKEIIFIDCDLPEGQRIFKNLDDIFKFTDSTSQMSMNDQEDTMKSKVAVIIHQRIQTPYQNVVSAPATSSSNNAMETADTLLAISNSGKDAKTETVGIEKKSSGSSEYYEQIRKRFSVFGLSPEQLQKLDREINKPNSSWMKIFRFAYKKFFTKNNKQMEIFADRYPLVCDWLKFEDHITQALQYNPFTEMQLKIIDNLICYSLFKSFFDFAVSVINHRELENLDSRITKALESICQSRVLDFSNLPVITSASSSSNNANSSSGSNSQSTTEIGKGNKRSFSSLFQAAVSVLGSNSASSSNLNGNSISEEQSSKKLKNDTDSSPMCL